MTIATILRDLVGVAGLGAIVAGVALVSAAGALIVAGGIMVAIALLLARKG